MNRTRGLLSLLLTVFVASTIGCHAQAPVTAHSIALTWQAPVPVSGGLWQVPCGTATGDAPCTYLLSRITVANGATSCQAPSATVVYTPLNSSSPATGLAYTDSSASGVTVCYVAQTIQNGSTGAASNTAGPFAVPANPGAPTLGNGAVSDLQRPQIAPPPAAEPETAREQASLKLEGHIR